MSNERPSAVALDGLAAASFGVLLMLFGAVEAKAGFNKWDYKATVDDFTDEIEETKASISIERPLAVLNVGCEDGTVSWSVSGEFIITGFGANSVKVRFDDDAPTRVEGFGGGFGGMAAIDFQPEYSRCPDCLSVEQIIQSLMRHNRLRIQALVEVLDFPLTGASEAISKVIDDCDAWNWLEGESQTQEDLRTDG